MTDEEMFRAKRKLQLCLRPGLAMILLVITLILGFISDLWWVLGATWTGVLLGVFLTMLGYHFLGKKPQVETLIVLVPVNCGIVQAKVAVSVELTVRIGIEEVEKWRDEMRRLRGLLIVSLKNEFFFQEGLEVSLEQWRKNVRRIFLQSRFFPRVVDISMEFVDITGERNFQLRATKLQEMLM
jgi:hypothetical protein